MDVRRLVGENVRRYRVAAGLSQEELAARMGVEQDYVSKLETGRKNPTAVTLWHTAIALDVDPAALFRSARKRSRSSKTRRLTLR